MEFKNKIIRLLLQVLILILIGGYFTSNIIQTTFATNINKSPNVIVTINGDGSTSQAGDLFDGQLYPATVKDAESGIGGISGVIRISNNFKKIDVNNMAIGLKNWVIRNSSPEEIVVSSFLENVRLKIERGSLLSFNKTIIDYNDLGNILYDKDSKEYKGYVLDKKDKFSISKGETIDLKYTLHMIPEAGKELQSVTVNMPIYINLMENITHNHDGDDDSDDKEVTIDEPIPQAALNKKDHIQYIQGYPDGTVRPEGLIAREEVSAVFYRLLDPDYRQSIKTINENFPDVGSDRWSLKHIATLANGKIINGYPDGSFKPGSFITRAELATIASKFDRLAPSVSNRFSDVEGHWANKYINSASIKGWVNGYPDGSFKPDQYITRAEFVTLVNNVLERKAHKENILPEARSFSDLLDTMWYYEAMVEAINSHHYTRLTDNSELWIEVYYPVLDM